ncbi:MAG: dihydrolipoyl dehydrogenase [Clostridia bacterium]|nr:dihydrolipoyl dehydrogenase [Clostridia bacterium]
MKHEFNVAVLGGGPGGYECAIRCAQLGLKTALIEARELGGTCLNRGCIPTKALLHGAEIYAEAKAGSEFGLILDGLTLNYARLAAYKDERVKRLVGGIEALEKAHGVEVIRGFGRLTGPNAMDVAGRAVSYDKLILATGSEPARPPVPGIESAYTSDDVLNATQLPSGAVIIGGGVIGIEFATLFSALGRKVIVIEMLPDILPGCAPEITAKLKALLKKRGVEFILGARVTEVVRGRTVRFERNGAADERTSSAVIVCAGRRPVTGDCGLERIGLATDRRGFVEVDDRLRTAIPDVYAIGDITGKIQLAHVASAQGMVAAANCAGRDETMRYDRVPACIYTSPEIAWVGLTEEAAREQGHDVLTGGFNIAANGRCLVMNETTGLIKLVADRRTGAILGCQIMAPRATDMIAEIAAVMAHGGTVHSLSGVIHPHPTVSEIIKEAAHDAEGLCVNAMPRRV